MNILVFYCNFKKSFSKPNCFCLFYCILILLYSSTSFQHLKNMFSCFNFYFFDFFRGWSISNICCPLCFLFWKWSLHPFIYWGNSLSLIFFYKCFIIVIAVFSQFVVCISILIILLFKRKNTFLGIRKSAAAVSVGKFKASSIWKGSLKQRRKSICKLGLRGSALCVLEVFLGWETCIKANMVYVLLNPTTRCPVLRTPVESMTHTRAIFLLGHRIFEKYDTKLIVTQSWKWNLAQKVNSDAKCFVGWQKHRNEQIVLLLRKIFWANPCRRHCSISVSGQEHINDVISENAIKKHAEGK